MGCHGDFLGDGRARMSLRARLGRRFRPGRGFFGSSGPLASHWHSLGGTTPDSHPRAFELELAQPPQVVGQRHQVPLRADLCQPPQQELTKAHHPLDDADARLHRALAPRIARTPLLRAQHPGHPYHGIGIERRGLGVRGKALLQPQVVLLATHRDQRLDLVLHAGLDVGFTAVARVGKQGIDLTQALGEGFQLLEHGLKLLLVDAGVSKPGAHNQQAFGVHRDLRVIGLVKAPAGHRHDARIGIGQIDLVLGPRPGLGRLGFDSAGLFAGLALALAPLPLGLVGGLLALEALLGALLDLSLCRAHRLPTPPAPRASSRFTSALSCCSRRSACESDSALWREALALSLVPSRATVPSFNSFICWASSNTCKNTSRTWAPKRRRKLAMVSWSGWVLAAM